MTHRLLAVLVVTLAVTACDQLQGPAAPPALVSLTIVPNPVPNMTVGQITVLTAVVSGSADQSATWTSSNLAVATVSTIGHVRCASIGVAVVTGTAVADTTARNSVTINCVAPIETDLIQITPASLTFTHDVGTTSCPQSAGTVRVTNTSSSAVQVTITSHAALTVDPTSFTLAAGASRTVTVRFNCSTDQSFVGTVTFTGVAGGVTHVRTLQVTGAVD